MLFGELAQGAGYLAENVARIDEEHLVFTGGVAAGVFMEKPQGSRQRHGVEHVFGQGQHHVDQAVAQEVAADVGLAVAGVAGAVGHY